jgi:hypothetical protein
VSVDAFAYLCYGFQIDALPEPEDVNLQALLAICDDQEAKTLIEEILATPGDDAAEKIEQLIVSIVDQEYHIVGCQIHSGEDDDKYMVYVKKTSSIDVMEGEWKNIHHEITLGDDIGVQLAQPLGQFARALGIYPDDWNAQVGWHLVCEVG